ncbi:MAG: hypothetical protein O9284_07455 [Steroidobacteraceae bacterium]|jgi:hypothetical protein|nr:hypothetical protein [Steroidobacteraceae bacterium]
MFGRIVRKFAVASGLVAVAGVAAAGALGFGELPRGYAEIELLDNQAMLQQDLGEIVVRASREDLPEVMVAAKSALPAYGVLADITVPARRSAPRVVEFSLLAGVLQSALVQ